MTRFVQIVRVFPRCVNVLVFWSVVTSLSPLRLAEKRSEIILLMMTGSVGERLRYARDTLALGALTPFHV
jgi:hypothetical protein